MVKPHASHIIACILAVTAVGCFAANIGDQQLRFLATQRQPRLLPHVTKRLGVTEIGQGPYYVYRLSGRHATVEFWLRRPPENMPPQGIPVEIAMVVERAADASPTIIWPRAMKGLDVEAAKKRFYPKMY